MAVDMTKYYRDFSASPLRRLQTVFGRTVGKMPSVMAAPPTLSQTAPSASATGTSTALTSPYNERRAQTAGVVGTYYSIHDWVNWRTIFTSSGVTFYGPSASGTEGVNQAIVSFDFDGTAFDLCDRAGGRWTIFADGEFVQSGFYTLTSAGGFAAVRLGVTFPGRVSKRIVCYGQSFGFAGVATDRNSSIAAVALDQQIKVAALTNSYGQAIAGNSVCGQFLECLFRMVDKEISPLFTLSAGGGSGFITGGSGLKTFQDAGRLACITNSNPDLVIVADPYNDGTTGLTAGCTAVFAALRAALPNAVIVSMSTFTPQTSSYGSGVAKHALVYPALQSIAGPWIDIDMTAGVWVNSSGATGHAGQAPWCTGTGKDGSPTGDGNADFVTNADGVHGSIYGSDYYARLTYTALRAAIAAI